MDFCLDIGGTSITAAGVENKKICTDLLTFSSNSKLSKDKILMHLCRIFDELYKITNRVPKAVRMAFPGPFDYENGVPQMSGIDKFDSLYGLSLPQELSKMLKEQNSYLQNVEFTFLNDVSAFGLGEALKLGWLKKHRGLYLCIGTGCGSVFLENGRPVGSETEGVPQNGWVYPIPFKGAAIDDWISKRGLMSLSKELCGKPLDGKQLAELCRKNDQSALNCYRRFGELLLEALKPIISSFSPDCIALGGQIMKSSELFIEPFESYCKNNGIELSICLNTAESSLVGLTL